MWTAAQLAATLSLPSTSFPQRVDAAAVDARLCASVSAGLYARQRAQSPDGRAEYTIHDGPPFANGDLHIGTPPAAGTAAHG